MKTPFFASKLFGNVWCCQPEAHRQLSESLRAYQWIELEKHEEEAKETGSLVIDGIAYIDVRGMIVPKAAEWEKEFWGLCDIETLNAQLDGAELRGDVEGVLMYYDTPGGYIGGVPELAERIATFSKPIVGYVEGGCHSAGYWLGCSQPLVAGMTAGVGSIGCYMSMIDASQMYEMNGLKTIVISTGEHKGAGTFGTKITEAQIAHIGDELVKPVGIMFADHVAMHRRIDESLMDGRSWLGEKAQELFLIDEVGSAENAYDMLIELIERKTK
jgi:ClpP class serine protease